MNNRTVKFRIYNKKTKSWIHGPNNRQSLDGVNLFGECIIFGNLIGDAGIEDLNEIEDLQFTGLKTKFGQEIFEGDIINTKANRYVVEYDNSRARFIGKGIFYNKEVFDLDTLISGYVMGNIFDNPQLLNSYF